MRGISNIKQQMAAINWLISVNPASNEQNLIALRMVYHSLSWVIEITELTPFEISKDFIRQNS